MQFDFRKYRNIYTADFETSTDAWDTESARVWLWDICDTNLKHTTGTDITEFMRKCIAKSRNDLYCFHNLAYDGAYILSWLLSHKYRYTDSKSEDMKPGEFTTIISDMGTHYAYEIVNKRNEHTVIMDTLKYVNMSIEKMAEKYDLPIKKGSIDYDLFRAEDWKPTETEISYIHNDTEIAMRVVQMNIAEGAYKFTQAGNARFEFKKLFSKDEYESLFPQIIDEDAYLRKAYYGGYVQVNPKYQNTVVTDMMSFDINSMYPAKMLHCELPFGYPMWFSGKYVANPKFPIYVQRFKCRFELKENGIPTIQSKSFFKNSDTLYLRSSGLKIFELTLTNLDIELLFDNYYVYDIEYEGGYMFMTKKGVEITPEQAKQLTVDEIIDQDGKGSYYYEYIKKWRSIKEHSKGAKRDYAKRNQNALYGAEATNPVRYSSIPYLNEDGILKYHIEKSDSTGKAEYLPAAIFIAAWARYDLIKIIMRHKDIFVYCDTDSLYLKCTTPPPDLPIHPSLYGFFKIEHYIAKFKCVGAKRYIYWGTTPENKDNFYSLNVTCCGADESIKKQMSFQNFNAGAEFYGKKSVHTVKGGKHIRLTTYRLGKMKERR